MRALLFLMFIFPVTCRKLCTLYQAAELIVVTEYDEIKIGRVPVHYRDNFDEKTELIGIVKNIRKIAYCPDNSLFYILNGDLYKAPVVCDNKELHWDSRRVGRHVWDKFKFIFFNHNSDFYAVTTEGDFYKGPKPDDENVCWHESVATKIGNGYWDEHLGFFFDRNGNLYAVNKDGSLVKGKPPKAPGNWLATTTKVGNNGWQDLTLLMAVHDDGKLWCVNKNNGSIYRGLPPTHEYDNYIGSAKHMGTGYNKYRLICLR